MSGEIWQEKAARLRKTLEDLNSALLDGVEDSPRARRELEEATIARFLRAEFSDEPFEDTLTRPLFADLPPDRPNAIGRDRHRQAKA